MKQSNSGFTLLELMVGIAILAIILGIGLPSFMNLFTNARVRATNDSVLEALAYARNQAVTQHHEITLCAANDNYDDCADGATAWGNSGWLVMQHDNHANTSDVLKVWQKPHNDVSVTTNNSRVVYRPTGMLDAQGMNATVTSVPVIIQVVVSDSPTLCYKVPIAGSVYMGKNCQQTDTTVHDGGDVEAAEQPADETPTEPTGRTGHSHHHHG